MRISLPSILGGVLCCSALLVEKATSEQNGPSSPGQQLQGFSVPEGFTVELIASEADGIINPIDLAFDDAGRLWTQTARMYPLDPVRDISWGELQKLINDPEAQKKYPEFKRILDLYQGDTKGTDQVLVLSELYGESKPKVEVFADGLAIPQSILPYGNGAFVAQGSELFHLADTDQDGKADRRTSVLTGFGFTDTHTMTHTLLRGPGDWIYFSQGALNKGEVTAVKSGMKQRFDFSKIGRFSIDGEKLEVVSSGLNNIWGFWMKANGEWWGSEANDMGWSVTPIEPGTGFTGIGSDQIRPYQPKFPRLHSFRVGGTGISALTYMEDEAGSFPERWKDIAFLANPITNAINAVRVVRNPNGTVTAEHLPDFLTSKDDWFRPVNIEFGPDGCLYIVDFYNKIISHNEVSTAHPDRDKNHGRIWRVRYTGAPERTIPNLYAAEPEKLVEHLTAPSIWEKSAAVNQITDRKLKSLGPAITAVASDDAATTSTRIHALWALEGIGHFDPTLMKALLNSDNHHERREAVRAMGRLAPDIGTLNEALSTLIADESPMVRAEALRAIADRGEASLTTIDILVSACKPEVQGNQLGGPYERKFERYLARKALEKFEGPLTEYFSSPLKDQQQSENLLWAAQALPENQRDEAFLKIASHQDHTKPLDESTFVIYAKMLPVPEAFELTKQTLRNPEHSATYVNYALKNQAAVGSPELSTMFSPVIEDMLTKKRQRMLALSAISKLKIPFSAESITKLLENHPSQELIDAALMALQTDTTKNSEIIARIASNPSLPFATRLNALHSLIQISSGNADSLLEAWFKSMTDDEKTGLTKELSTSKQGSLRLIKAYQSGSLTPADFEFETAKRIRLATEENEFSTQLFNQVKAAHETKEKQLADRIAHMKKIPERLDGDPSKGKTLFATCMLCHRVGNEGHDIAPALDGSGHRDREALLTAILAPDAAVEGGYLTYRVKKKNETTMEGFLSKEDESGVGLSFMGGSSVFIPAEDIASKGFVSGRSFMPQGLIDNYSDQQVADLLAYISTLK